MTVAVPQSRFADTLIYILSHRATHVATLVWVLANAAAYWLGRGSIPFDMPPMHDVPFGTRMLIPTISLIEVLALMGIAFWITRKRDVQDGSSREEKSDRTAHGGPSPQPKRTATLRESQSPQQISCQMNQLATAGPPVASREPTVELREKSHITIDTLE